MAPDPADPSRSIRLVVGYLRNGAIESIARVLAGRLGVDLGQPVVIDSRPGVGGTLGLAAVARAAPDGYTLLVTSTTTMSIAPYLYGRQRVHGLRGDFVPVALVTPFPQGLMENTSVSAPDLQAHIDWLKRSGGTADGVYAPPGTPGAIVDRLAAAIVRTMRTFEVRAQLAKQGVDLVVLTGMALRAYLDLGNPAVVAPGVRQKAD